LIGHDRLNGEARALVRDMRDLKTGHAVENLAGEMVWAADTGRRIEHLAWFRTRQVDVLLQRMRWHRRMHDQHDGIARQQRDRSEILQRIVADRLADMWGDHERGFGRDQQRVAVRIGFCHHFGADPAGRAGTVLDDDRLAQQTLQMRRQQP
jgi:hypothetical protein